MNKTSFRVRTVVVAASGFALSAVLGACGTGDGADTSFYNPAASAAALAPEVGADRYIVTMNDDVRGRSALRGVGARVARELGAQRAVAAHLSASAVAALRADPSIESLELDPVRKPLAQAIPYGIDMVQAPLVWGGADGAGRKVCIIDSGFYTGHEDLQDAGVAGYPADWSTDRCGHGSHVGGTIAALSNDLGVVGVLPHGVDLFIVKVFGDDCAWVYASDLVDALNRCVAAGANVVSMSLGGGRKSTLENRAFASAYANGVLSIAAAGNDGTTALSYPASYNSVVSVAAVDSSMQHASFSQTNSQVELAAPGVSVLSSVPWIADNQITVDGVTYQGGAIDGAPTTPGTVGALADGGLCDTVGSWAGKIVLCARGTITFADKVLNAQVGGAVAAVIYNNVPGSFAGTLSGVVVQIPAISLSQEDGQFLVASKLGFVGTVVSTLTAPASGYESWDGTSMATPHVSGVAALVWSQNPAWTNVQIRDALDASALDLGVAGRDVEYGFGLVQAQAALDYLNAGGGGTSITLSVTGRKVRGVYYADLVWSGASGTTVDVYRNDAFIAATANDGAMTDVVARGTYTYRVCEAGTSICSNDAAVNL
ncbi:MAG: S8 family serine peptidase [Myxococcota bacterium]